jgi:acetyl-CoA C-acetyltransferase
MSPKAHLRMEVTEDKVLKAPLVYSPLGLFDCCPTTDGAAAHDCFSITEIINYEDLGFCGPGEGGRFVEEGRANLEGGELPVNPSGGLKSFGHPVGATGVRMIYELTLQLQARAGQRQVKDAELGLAHNLGGPGAVSCVAILGNGR